MTTIAYRDGVMAADSGCWNGNACHGWAEKLARGPDGSLHGVAGKAAACEGYLQWVRDGFRGEKPLPQPTKDDESTFVVLVYDKDGVLSILTAFGSEGVSQAPYMAIGAGAETAMGALFMGATAEQAIDAAVEHSSGAFGKIKSIRR